MSQNDQGRAERSVYIFEVIFCVLGLGSLIAWFCLAFFMRGDVLGEASGHALSYTPRLVFLIALSATMLLALLFTRHVNNLGRLGVLWGGGVVLLIAAWFAPLLSVRAALFGAGSFVLVAIWFVYLYEKRTNYALIAASIVVGSLASMGISLASDSVSRAVVHFLPYVSAVICLACVFSIRRRINKTLSTATIWKVDFEIKYFVFFITFDLTWGFTAFLVCWDASGTAPALTIGAVGTVVGIAVLALSRNAFYTFERLLRSCAIIVAGVLLCVIAISTGTVRTCFAMALFGFILSSEALGIIRDINQGVDRPFNEIYLISFEGLFSTVFGCAGFLLAMVVYLLSPDFPILQLAIPLLLFILIAAAALYSVGNFELPSSEKNTTDAYSIWGRRVQRMASRYDTMHAQIQQIADDYELTPRQTEIFHGLSRGRNAKFFQDTLYLSEGTVKTHISAIYRKLDVHSRQELISFVENYKPEDKH